MKYNVPVSEVSGLFEDVRKSSGTKLECIVSSRVLLSRRDGCQRSGMDLMLSSFWPSLRTRRATIDISTM